MKLPNIVKNDSYLEPFASIIIDRLQVAKDKEQEVLHGCRIDFAPAHPKWNG